MKIEQRSLLMQLCLLAICIFCIGCARGTQNVTAHIDRLTGKIHAQEEEILRLRQEVIDLQQSNSDLRKKQEDDGPGVQLPGDAKPPNVTIPGQTSVDESPADPELVVLEPKDSISPANTANVQRRVNVQNQAAPSNEIDPKIDKLYLHPHATGGFDSDGKPGDDGLSVLIEPRNSLGQYVPIPAPISVALLDPALRGSQKAVVGRWRFSSKQVEQMIHDSPSGRGIYVKVPWKTGNRPGNSRLALFIQYTSMDGRKVETKKEIFVRLPGQVAGWTRRLDSKPKSQTPSANVARQRHPDQVIVDPKELERPKWRPNRE